MSLSRLALRLTAMEAARPTAALAAGPFPTLAGKLVFDSRLDPIEDLNPAEQQPVVTVYTEDDAGTGGQARGGPPFKRMVDLCFEIAVVVSTRPRGADAYQAFYPETDAELEASLDLLEAQIRFALFYGPTGALWRQLTGRKVPEIHSLPHHTAEERIRLARRTVRMKVQLPDDDYDPAPGAAPTGNARLPEPLRGVIAQLSQTCYGAVLAAGLSAAAPVMPVATPLQAVGLNQDTAAPTGAFDGVVDVANAAKNLQG
jgi:hypothetical protein